MIVRDKKLMSGLQRCRCAIVDRDVFMRRMLRDMLRYFGIGLIEEVKDGASALFKAGEQPFDLMITEIVMGGGSLEMVSAIRRSKTPLDAKIPIIGFSETVTHEMVAAVRDSGMSEIMVKPFSSGVLLKKLSTVFFTPRPFVQQGGYFGPCRRRKDSPHYFGPFRREVDRLAAIAAEAAAAAPPTPTEPAIPGAMSQDALSQRFGGRPQSKP